MAAQQEKLIPATPEVIAVLPKAYLLVGPEHTPFDIPIICLDRISTQFTAYLFQKLPRRDGFIVCEEISEELFKLLGQFQYKKNYNVFFQGGIDGTATDAVVAPAAGTVASYAYPIFLKPANAVAIAPAPQGRNDNAAARKSFDEFRGPANSIINALLWTMEHDHRHDAMENLIVDFMVELAPSAVNNREPPEVDARCLLIHAHLYIIGMRFNIPELCKLARAKLLWAVLRARMTYDFAGAYCQLLRFIFTNTVKCDPIRAIFHNLGLYISDLFLKHHAYRDIFFEFNAYTEEIFHMNPITQADADFVASLEWI
ncbi:hypothetical protein F4677DRAFT_458723 [Hypoxylon crocopeplum]|nr:hypothetical protein F4677DRAFT_458723 [Hypoxylon crocopeplum]